MEINTIELARRIRLHALEMTSRGESSHIGSVLSVADILAVLYGAVLRINPADPTDPSRDRFILSKGHAGAGVYAALAETGFLPTARLATHCQDGSMLSGHVSHKNVPGVEFSTGSLGHGLPVAAGMAYAARMRRQSHRVVVLLSDGECDEGSNWEAMLFAAHQQLDNLLVIVDYNKLQSLASVQGTLGLEPFVDKWASFGWLVSEMDGHDHQEIRQVLEQASVPDPLGQGRPKCLIAHTVKGKGVSFMEHQVLWHYRTARGAEYQAAWRELAGDAA
ncbi:MAG: transketolase [Planctomycetes bacterium]|nr:transketolase [Planctomycetota bacterium]